MNALIRDRPQFERSLEGQTPKNCQYCGLSWITQTCSELKRQWVIASFILNTFYSTQFHLLHHDSLINFSFEFYLFTIWQWKQFTAPRKTIQSKPVDSAATSAVKFVPEKAIWNAIWIKTVQYLQCQVIIKINISNFTQHVSIIHLPHQCPLYLCYFYFHLSFWWSFSYWIYVISIKPLN